MARLDLLAFRYCMMEKPLTPSTLPVLALAALSLAFGGCATMRTDNQETAQVAAAAAAAATTVDGSKPSAPGSHAATPAAAAAAAAAAAMAAQSQHRPFAEVVKDAKEMPGMFQIYQREERVWLEIAPEQFEKPFFFAVNMSNGLGEKFL